MRLNKTGFKTNLDLGKDTINGIKKKGAPVILDEDFRGESNTAGRPLEYYDAYRITKERDIPRTIPTITIGGAKVAAPCNITAVTAEGKGGKTAFKGVLVAGAISKDGIIDGFTDVEVTPNPTGKAVLDFDTEQSEEDQQYNHNTSLSRAGLTSTPDYCRSYNIRTLPLTEYKEFTTNVCRLCSEKFGGIHLIFIDGGADYITSVNDEAEANAIVSFFTWLSVEFNCAVLLIIHLNENAGKNADTLPRGHVGRQAVRKGYAQLNISKEGDISTLQVLRARKAGHDTPLVCFQYSHEKGFHISVDSQSVVSAKQADKDLIGRRRAEKIASKIFAPPKSLSYTDAIVQIMKATSKSKATAKRYLEDMQGWEIVKKHDDSCYRLAVIG